MGVGAIVMLAKADPNSLHWTAETRWIVGGLCVVAIAATVVVGFALGLGSRRRSAGWLVLAAGLGVVVVAALITLASAIGNSSGSDSDSGALPPGLGQQVLI